jgi:hypothetical protein
LSIIQKGGLKKGFPTNILDFWIRKKGFVYENLFKKKLGLNIFRKEKERNIYNYFVKR